MKDAFEVVTVPVETGEVQAGGLGPQHRLGNGGVARPQLGKLRAVALVLLLGELAPARRSASVTPRQADRTMPCGPGG